MFADGDELCLHDSPQCHGVDGNAGALSDNDDEGAFELEVDEEGNVIDALAALGQLGEDQESTPALALLRQAHTLPDGSKRFHVALRYPARTYNANRAYPSVAKEEI